MSGFFEIFYMAQAKGFTRSCICLCGNLAELRRDKRQRPYLTCKGCSVKIFFQGDENPGYLGYLVVEKAMKANLPVHRNAVGEAYYEKLRNLEAQKRAPKARKGPPKARKS